MGTTSSHHVSYGWGYTCNTMFVTESSKLAITNQRPKTNVYGLRFETQPYEVGLDSNHRVEPLW